MSIKVGVWIDHKQAIMVLVKDAGKEIKKITSGIETPVRSGANHSYTRNDFVPEDRLERKLDSQLQKFYDEVIVSLKGAESLLILGPCEAKGQLHKRLKSKKIRSLLVELEPADKMTDRQLAAKVAQHFITAPVKKSVAPKKVAMMVTTKKKTAKAN
ncbi:MAG: hypothetical protein NTV50_02835 [Planctomycetota bacterium]|nr:hypothetical protein [Planctomycetota bacterium]